MMARITNVLLLIASTTLASGCLEPRVSDEVPPKGLVLPAGSVVPSAHDDPQIELQIAEHDGVDGTIPLLSGFAEGAPARFWDFGEAPAFSAPLFVLMERDENEELVPLPHNTIIDAIPGAPGYSPFWAVLHLEVTDLYDGELITSFAAVEEAQELGLVESPHLSTFAINCPVVASDVTLDVGDPGGTNLAPPSEFYWQGKRVKYYDLGQMPTAENATPSESSMIVLAKEGQLPVSEPERNVDVTGDGDTLDTNNVFEFARLEESYTPLTRRINVTLAESEIRLIDSTRDQEDSEVNRFSEVLGIMPLPEIIAAFEITDELRNLPQQLQPGGL